MTGYRFLSPAEEEMTEAALFYDAASNGLGNDFLDDVQQAIESCGGCPQTGEALASGLRRMLLHRFPFSIIYSVETHNSGHRNRASWPKPRLLAVSR